MAYSINQNILESEAGLLKKLEVKRWLHMKNKPPKV